tara:strand:- start:1471 stop:1839 length:369 start_codon:yes stop_codon:yes gene_type:complete
MKASVIPEEILADVLDEDRKIPRAHLDSVCKFGHKSETCRYITLTLDGYVCVKKTGAKLTIDKKVADGDWLSKGDNCEGLGRGKQHASSEEEKESNPANQDKDQDKDPQKENSQEKGQEKGH